MDTFSQWISHLQWPRLLFISVVGYVLLVPLLRYRRRDSLSTNHGFHTAADLARMTHSQAQTIVKQLVRYEFPWSVGTASGFVFFKTYGIPSISALLYQTGELHKEALSSKRNADTAALILEFLIKAPHSPRSLDAIARMNWLHARYQKAGKIANADMLFTLVELALEPGRWVERYEWRLLNDIELCALGTFYKGLGDRMGIDYSELSRAKTGWANGLEWLQDVDAWSQAYRAKEMKPSPPNYKLAVARLRDLTTNMPRPVKAVFSQLFNWLMDDQLRTAVMIPQPGKLYSRFFKVVFQLRKLWLRHLALPRFMPDKLLDSNPDPLARHHLEFYDQIPWYVKPTWFARHGPEAWLNRLLGGKVPGDNGTAYSPQGYLIRELGPVKLQGQGAKEMDVGVERLKQQSVGCPFR